MTKGNPESNIRYLLSLAPKMEGGGTSKEEVPSVSDEVKQSARPADVLQLRKTRLQDELPSNEIFARRLPELLALDAAEVVGVNLAAPKVVVRVLGVLPKLNALRGQIEATFRTFDFEQFDSLEDYAFTLNYAETLVRGAARPPRCSPGLRREALTLQRRLLADCRALEVRDMVDGSRLRRLQEGQGFQIWASNLVILANVLNDSWPSIVGRCATTPADLKRAGEVADQLLRIAGQREKWPESVARAKDLRARAFTLLTRAYHEARVAALSVLGSKRALDAVAPPLSSGRKRGRRPRRAKRELENGSTAAENLQDSPKQ